MLYNYYIFKCMLKALIKKIDILKNQSTIVVLHSEPEAPSTRKNPLSSL